MKGAERRYRTEYRGKKRQKAKFADAYVQYCIMGCEAVPRFQAVMMGGCRCEGPQTFNYLT